MKNKIKFTNKYNAHQGDVQMLSIDKLPSNAVRLEKKEFIAKSERSGHAHALCGDYEMFTAEGYDGFFVNVKGELAVMNHAKYAILNERVLSTPKETEIADHKPTIIPAGTYYIGIQRRVNPYSSIWEKVKD